MNAAADIAASHASRERQSVPAAQPAAHVAAGTPPAGEPASATMTGDRPSPMTEAEYRENDLYERFLRDLLGAW